MTPLPVALAAKFRPETGSIRRRHAWGLLAVPVFMLSSSSSQQRVVEAPIGESLTTPSAPDTPLDQLAVGRAERKELDDAQLQHDAGYGIPWVAPTGPGSPEETPAGGAESRPAEDNAAETNGSSR